MFTSGRKPSFFIAFHIGHGAIHIVGKEQFYLTLQFVLQKFFFLIDQHFREAVIPHRYR